MAPLQLMLMLLCTQRCVPTSATSETEDGKYLNPELQHETQSQSSSLYSHHPFKHNVFQFTRETNFPQHTNQPSNLVESNENNEQPTHHFTLDNQPQNPMKGNAYTNDNILKLQQLPLFPFAPFPPQNNFPTLPPFPYVPFPQSNNPSFYPRAFPTFTPLVNPLLRPHNYFPTLPPFPSVPFPHHNIPSFHPHTFPTFAPLVNPLLRQNNNFPTLPPLPSVPFPHPNMPSFHPLQHHTNSPTLPPLNVADTNEKLPPHNNSPTLPTLNVTHTNETLHLHPIPPQEQANRSQNMTNIDVAPSSTLGNVIKTSVPKNESSDVEVTVVQWQPAVLEGVPLDSSTGTATVVGDASVTDTTRSASHMSAGETDNTGDSGAMAFRSAGRDPIVSSIGNASVIGDASLTDNTRSASNMSAGETDHTGSTRRRILQQCSPSNQHSCRPDNLRSDGRCGPFYPLINGKPAHCDPSGFLHCCSREGRCGYSEDDCNCDGCIDYRAQSNCSCGIANTARRTRRNIPKRILVVGGSKVDIPRKYPWLVILLITYPDGHKSYCGGSIINDVYVLTAAHCIELKTLKSTWTSWLPWVKKEEGCTLASQTKVTVFIGDHDVYDPNDDDPLNTISREVTNIIIHPEYYCQRYDHDVALLRLAAPIQFNDVIKPVCLPEYDIKTYENKMATVAGWGHLEFGVPHTPSVPYEVDIPILAPNCDGYNDVDITEDMLCAGYPKTGGKDACQGDSGGPLVVEEDGKYVQVGIVSHGMGCAWKDHPGVYTRVSKVIKFIYGWTKGPRVIGTWCPNWT